LCPPEFRRHNVELGRARRTPEEPSRGFGPTAQTIHNWVKQADLDEGRSTDGLTTEEREELRRLRRGDKQPKIEKISSSRPEVSLYVPRSVRKIRITPGNGPAAITKSGFPR
jgi:transposase